MKNIHFKMLRVSFLTLFFVVIAGSSFYANAVNMSAHRIYLDNNKINQSFVIFNQNTDTQNCSLGLRHYDFDDIGTMTIPTLSDTPENSAESWIRFSPKKFVLTPAHSQTVRFIMRRKANITAQEYRAYLVVDCGVESRPVETLTNDNQAKLTVSPKLVHNIPIIVRTGALEAKVTLSDIKIVSGVVHFNINRTGNRSVYGDVGLFNKKTGDRVSFQTGVSIYPETSRIALSLPTGEYNTKDLVLRFIENKLYGGDLEVELDFDTQ